jgi:hypothetical protein
MGFPLSGQCDVGHFGGSSMAPLFSGERLRQAVSSLISTARYMSPGGRPGVVRPLAAQSELGRGSKARRNRDEHLVSRALLVERQSLLAAVLGLGPCERE